MRALIAITIALLLVPCALAATLQAEVSFYPDGSASIDRVRVTVAGIDQENPADLPDKVELFKTTTIHSTAIPVTFRLLDAGKVDRYSSTIRMPYLGNKGELRVVRNGTIVTKFDLALLCNHDNRCNGFENALSCPADCPLTSIDQVCIVANDGACDPDCAYGLDKDCGTLPKTESRQDFTPWAILVLALVTAAVFLWLKESN